MTDNPTPALHDPARLPRAHLALLACGIVAGALALTVQDSLVNDRYMTDDAFISFRYARNLADGLGPVWSHGNRVEGYTNFGWILILAATMKAGLDPIATSRVLGFLATLGILTLIPVLASQLRPRGSFGWWVVTGGSLAALSVNTGLSLWTFAGLETPAFTFFVTAAVTSHLWEARTGSGSILSALLLLIACLIRPDGVVVFAVIAAAKALSVATGSRSRFDVISLALWMIAFALPFGAYWLWRWSYYGDLLPNTYYLKTGTSRAFFQRGAWYAWDFFSVYSVWLGLGVLVSVWRERTGRYHPSLFGLVLVLAWFAYVATGGGDWMPYFRFFLPIVPLLYVLIMQGLVDVAELLNESLHAPRGVLRAVVVAGAFLVVASSLRPYGSATAQNPSGDLLGSLPGSVNRRAHEEIGLWFKDNLPGDYTVAEIATGIVPYYSELPTLDMLGVNDHHIAHRDVDVGNGPAGHDKQDGAYVLLSRPEVIWLGLELEPVPRSSPQDYMPPAYVRSAPVIVEVTQNAYVWVLYRPVAIKLDDGWLNLLVRSDVTAPALSSKQ